MEDLGEKLDITVSTSVPRHLYDVNEGCEKLDEKRAEVFRSITAKNYLSQKGLDQTWNQQWHFCVLECQRVMRMIGKTQKDVRICEGYN
eukprot:7834343-Ditylum_brightwellii.AAC.1